MFDAEISRRPIALDPIRVRRTYRGGSGLDRWHNAAAPQESDRPKEWFASMTAAVNPGFPPIENEGLSVAELPGRRILLRELVQQAPQAMLGTAHAQRFGAQPGVLVKMIDSAERLSIQVHPDKAFARRYFHSEFGKTECWHILETRAVNGQPPCLLLGFRPGVTREQWEALFREQDIPGMVACLNRVTPQAGETWLIRGGMPHAIGPGCRLVEIQESTDYTLRSERTQADGTPIPDAPIHQGLGEQALMECFLYEPMDETALREACCLAPQTVVYPDSSSWQLLVGPQSTPCFSMERITAAGCLCLNAQDSFSILAILEGAGTLRWPGGECAAEKSQQFFLPAGVQQFELTGTAQQPLTAIRCHPPGVYPAAPTP